MTARKKIDMIEKLVTARGPEYFVGGLVSIDNGGEEYRKIASIEFVGGDYELGSMAAYYVNLSDGRTILVKDAAEVWQTPEPMLEPGVDPRDGEPTVTSDDGIEIPY
jgi:hypothetical protein